MFMKMVVSDFPAGTMHICLLSLRPEMPPRYIGTEFGENWYLAPDNGLLPLLLPDENVEYRALLYQTPLKNALKDVLLPGAAKMTSEAGDGEPLPVRSTVQRVGLLSPTLQQNSMRLTVIYNDPEGNAIFNIDEQEFERLRAGRRFRLIWPTYRREINQIHHHPGEVEQGYLAAWFGPGGLLQLSMNGGSASQYYGLTEKQMVMLEFTDN